MRRLPENAEFHFVYLESPDACIRDIENGLSDKPKSYDVIVIDGAYRHQMCKIARRLMAEDGIIICDDSEGYGFHDAMRDSSLHRVDFYGFQPGVVLPHATSVFFNSGCFAFHAEHRIANICIEDV